MGGKWNIPLATWTGTVFFLRYYRQQQGVAAILLSILPIFLAAHVFFMGLAEQVELQFKVFIALCFTLYMIIPCLIDQQLARRITNPLIATLVYPSALISVQFFLSFSDQLGTILSWTGSFFPQKPLLQMISVTGIWGPSFLVGWLASTVNQLWELQFDFRKARTPLFAFSTIVFVVVLLGNIRIQFFKPAPGTVKVGSVVVGFQEDNLFYTFDDAPESFKIAEKATFRALSLQVQDSLFAASVRLMPSGIKILSWASGNAVVFAEDEAKLVTRMQEFARLHRVYFFPGLQVLGNHFHPDDNHVLAILPDGTIAYDHYKGRNPGRGFYEGKTIETIETPYGKIASPICFEMEFHRFIRQAGKEGVDIMIVPGDEPARGAADMHTEYSMLRAVENGFSMLRTTLEGLTMGADYQGRVLSQMSFYNTLHERTLITEMPVKGIRTFYAMTGDWFAWGCVILLGVMVVMAFVCAKVNDSLNQ
jgi:apolipoprotein N-acyltransferase